MKKKKFSEPKFTTPLPYTSQIPYEQQFQSPYQTQQQNLNQPYMQQNYQNMYNQQPMQQQYPQQNFQGYSQGNIMQQSYAQNQYPQQMYYNQYQEEETEENIGNYFVQEEDAKKWKIITLSMSIFSFVYLFFKEVFLIKLLNIQLERMPMSLLQIFAILFFAISFIMAVYTKIQDKQKYLGKISYMLLFISGLGCVESIYLLLMFYFAK